MPADQIVDIDVDVNVGVLLQIADVGAVAVGAAVNQPQIGFGQHARIVADIRIFGDAALEDLRAGIVCAQLADQIETSDLAECLAADRTRCGLFCDLGDQADDESLGAHQPHEFSDGRLFTDCGVRHQVDS